MATQEGVHPQQSVQAIYVPRAKRGIGERYIQYWLILPALITMCAVLIYPLGYSFWISFFDWTITSFEHPFIGLRNYTEALTSSSSQFIFFQNIAFTIICILLEFVIGIALEAMCLWWMFTRVTALEWDEARRVWRIRTDRGDDFTAQYIGLGTGPLHVPKLPGIPGLESFRGHSFHTSRWDYAYTGGDPSGAPMTGLADKRVAIIGTGATAVQCIPPLARSAKELYVFQRTPSSIDVRNNRPLDAAEFDLSEGWQRRWLTNFATLQTGGFTDVDLVQDGWTDIAKRVRDRVVTEIQAGAEYSPETMERAYHDSDDEKMTEIRARVDAIVDDEATAEALKPWYRQLCKRPCFHDEYLQTYNRPNVTLVNTDGKGVERITEKGVVANGQEYEVDCIIYASGFEVGTPLERRAGYEVFGEGGLSLSDKWKDGVATLYGMQTRGFPNCFIVGLAQVGGSANITHVLDVQSRHIAYVIESAIERGAAKVDVTQEAEDRWVDTIIRASMMNISFLEQCTPGYYNNEGQPNGELIRQNGAYAPGIMAFSNVLEAWKAEGKLDGLVFA